MTTDIQTSAEPSTYAASRAARDAPEQTVGVVSPTISVAMCTYNGGQFLEEQLKSFLIQTVLPDHMVVCDDGSTDATRPLLTEFARIAPFPVELRFNVQTLGVAKNFEQALLACNSDFVALCDQDDRWHPAKLQRLRGMLQLNPKAGFACSDAELIDRNGKSLNRKLWDIWRIDPETLSQQIPPRRRAHFVRSNCVTGATMMLRREQLWDCLAPIPSSWVHDHWLAVLCEVLNRPGCATPDLLTQYRLHAGQTIGVGARGWFRRPSTIAERTRKCEQRGKRYRDLLLHLIENIIPRIPEAAEWIEVIHLAQQDLEERKMELNLPWWHRGWNRMRRSWRPAA